MSTYIRTRISESVAAVRVQVTEFTWRTGQGRVEDGKVDESVRGQEEVGDDGSDDVQLRWQTTERFKIQQQLFILFLFLFIRSFSYCCILKRVQMKVCVWMEQRHTAAYQWGWRRDRCRRSGHNHVEARCSSHNPLQTHPALDRCCLYTEPRITTALIQREIEH